MPRQANLGTGRISKKEKEWGRKVVLFELELRKVGRLSSKDIQATK